jgi:hypothetical protein
MSFVPRFEIFQKRPAELPTWVETATSLGDAKNRLKQLAIMFPADYFIFDTKNACFVIPHDVGPQSEPAIHRRGDGTPT